MAVLTQVEFGKRWNVSGQRISALVRKGHISKVPGGVDVEQADDYMRNRPKILSHQVSGVPAGVARERVVEIISPTGEHQLKGARRFPSNKPRMRVSSSPTERRAAAQADLAELEYQKRTGMLINRDGVEAMVNRAGALLHGNMDSMARRLSIVLSKNDMMPREVAAILDDAFRRMLDTFVDALILDPPPEPPPPPACR